MRTFFKQNGKWIAINIVAWAFSKQLFLAIKLWGIENTGFSGVQIPVSHLFVAITISGLIDGVVFGLIDAGFDHSFKRLGFFSRILSKTLLNLSLGLILTIVLVPMLLGMTHIKWMAFLSGMLATTNLIILAMYILTITFLLQLSKLAASWIQTFDLFQILSLPGSGIEEDRIFMFLDMKSSTMHAEKMGAEKYSALIRDCFQDMTKAAEGTDAEIYQYVGDEVIFTWKTSDQNFKNSVQHYFHFRKNLFQRSTYYREQYGIVPEFKAGIHHGRVIRTQVGVTRKSIAFHGDAVNTAARIQNKCNELDRDLLVSTAILDGLPQNCYADYEGSYQLRGKNHEINLFSIHKPVKENTHTEDGNNVQQKVKCSKIKLPAFRMWLNTL